jgi:hypothetical protein
MANSNSTRSTQIFRYRDKVDDYPYFTKSDNINLSGMVKQALKYVPVVYDGVNNIDRIPPNVVPHLSKFERGYLVIYDNWNDTQQINSITDIFSERVRVKCHFKDHLSPIKYWSKHKKYILSRVDKRDILGLREYLYFNTKLCNTFRITVALAVLQMFKPKKWLDISAGWGDRLISAILYGVDLYVSADPNLDLHPCYNTIINTLAPKQSKSNFIIYPSGFETASIPNVKYDIVFSSPPFFDLETYSNHIEDSLQYSNEDLWCTKFLWPCLIKAYRHLRRNGHMILYMSGSPIVMAYLRKLDNIMKYKGVIYFIDTRPRAMYVWQKTTDHATDL